jgi:hypothetical protein
MARIDSGKLELSFEQRSEYVDFDAHLIALNGPRPAAGSAASGTVSATQDVRLQVGFLQIQKRKIFASAASPRRQQIEGAPNPALPQLISAVLTSP